MNDKKQLFYVQDYLWRLFYGYLVPKPGDDGGDFLPHKHAGGIKGFKLCFSCQANLDFLKA